MSAALFYNRFPLSRVGIYLRILGRFIAVLNSDYPFVMSNGLYCFKGGNRHSRRIETRNSNDLKSLLERRINGLENETRQTKYIIFSVTGKSMPTRLRVDYSGGNGN